jgi:hypothetical protein
MKAIGCGGIGALIISLWLNASYAWAQEAYFRVVSTPDRTAQVTPLLPEEEEKYNLMLGPVRFGSAAGLGLEGNDNIAYSHANRQSDFILHPSLALNATWRITELNTLRFSIGASYAKYFSHPQFDSNGVILSPQTELAFTMNVGQVALTFRDRFSYQEDPYQFAILSNVERYRRFYNEASVQADWQITEATKLAAGFSHFNVWTFGEGFGALQRHVDTIYLRPSVRVTPAVKVGLNGSASIVDYSENIQNDGRTYLLGPFVEADLTGATKLYAELGIQRFTFSDNGTINDSSNSSSWYMRTSLDNQWSEALGQHLSFTKTTETGFLSNFYDLYHFEYGLDWKMTPSLGSVASAFFEHYRTSGNDSETANRYGVALGLRYVLTPSVTCSVDYRFLLKDSNVSDLSYRQNLVMLSLYYNF